MNNFDINKYGYKLTKTSEGKPVRFAPKTETEQEFYQQLNKAIQVVVAEAKAKHGEDFIPQVEVEILEGFGIKINCKNF